MVNTTEAGASTKETPEISDTEFFKQNLNVKLTKIQDQKMQDAFAPNTSGTTIDTPPPNKEESNDEKPENGKKDDTTPTESTETPVDPEQKMQEDNKDEQLEQPKVNDTHKEPTSDTKPNEDHHQHKKTARERVQESRREVKHWKNEYTAAQERLLAMERELAELKTKPEDQRTQKDNAKEIYYEDQLKLAQRQDEEELSEYIATKGSYLEQQAFIADYKDIVPKIAEKDKFTIDTISKLPEKYQVLDMFFESLATGQLKLDEWISKPASHKLRVIDAAVRQINGTYEQPKETKTETEKAEEKVAQKPLEKLTKMPDSVVPLNSKNGSTDPNIEIDDNSFFEKSLGKPIRFK